MLGADHYREAERWLAHSKHHTDTGHEADRHIADVAAAQAQVHATLAYAAAVIEAADVMGGIRLLAAPPLPADGIDPAYPGTPWGRAFHGDRHLITDQEN